MAVQEKSLLAIPLQGGNTKDHPPVVLVVEDNQATRDMLSWALHLQGYRPICTANGQEALGWMEHTEQTPEYPLAILLDLRMPVMDGRQFLATFRAQHPGSRSLPPTIVMTVERCDSKQLGCHAILVKPFHLWELRTCLQQVTKRDG